MNKLSKIFTGVIFIATAYLPAQTVYYNADQFPLLGKTSEETETRYERLPVYLKDVCRPSVWRLGKNTSGLAIRFMSNSTSIAAKWEVVGDNKMNHMTETGIKGVDLYTWEEDHWQPIKAGLPSGKMNEKTIISNMTPQEREFMLYLPLYDGVVSLEIGIDSSAYIKQPVLPYPDTSHPILVYGTSITQGGCANRAGMSYTNILSRKLNREVINLGFSGNGLLDYEIAGLMATRRDASLFVLDFVPNASVEQVSEKTRPFVDILRKDNPDTPILFVEMVVYPHSYYDKELYGRIIEKNKLLREEYEKIKREGDKNVFYLSNDHLIGNDGEATVDGVHFTDLGFHRFADVIHEKIYNIEQVTQVKK